MIVVLKWKFVLINRHVSTSSPENYMPSPFPLNIETNVGI